jgi:hypothetical protein
MGCHSEAGVSWSMEDPERTYQRRRRIASAITNRRMPPWLAEGGHQEYVGDRSLDDASVELIRRWAENGFPKGEARPDPAPVASNAMAHHMAFAPDLSLEVIPGTSYLPNQERSDDYRCFLVEWPGEEMGYVTGFRALPGNRRVGHHAVVMAVEPGMWDRFMELEDVDEGPGYQCFGGAVPDNLVQPERRAEYEARYPDGIRELDQSNFWLAHWAPGMDGHVFPEGTGIPMKPGSGLVVQMHYYASAAPGEADAGTRVEFMVEDDVERPAFHLSQTRGDWLRGERNQTMVIPAGEQKRYEVRNRMSDLMGLVSYVTGVPADEVQGLELHSANIHMHAFGHSGEVMLTHGTGWAETLLRIPRWDLNWQRDFAFLEPKYIPRDELERTFLTIRCNFENTTEGPVYGGYGSMDEMCFNFSYIAVQKGQATTTGGRPE